MGTVCTRFILSYEYIILCTLFIAYTLAQLLNFIFVIFSATRKKERMATALHAYDELITSDSYALRFFKKFPAKDIAVCLICKNVQVETTIDAYSHLHQVHYEQFVESITLNYPFKAEEINLIPFNATEANHMAKISKH